MRHSRIGLPAQKLRGLIVSAIQVALFCSEGGRDWGCARIQFPLPLICLGGFGSRGCASISIAFVNVVTPAQLVPGRGVSAVQRDRVLQCFDRHLVGTWIQRISEAVKEEIKGLLIVGLWYLIGCGVGDFHCRQQLLARRSREFVVQGDEFLWPDRYFVTPNHTVLLNIHEL